MAVSCPEEPNFRSSGGMLTLPQVPYPQVVFGDSAATVSQSPRRLLVPGGPADALGCIRRLDVVNRGFSGWNTANAIRYLDKLFPEPTEWYPKIEYLIVLLGANDAVLPQASTAQHVSIEDYKQNLTKIVLHPHIQVHGPKILLVTPPPVDELKCTKLNMEEGHPSAIRTFATTAFYAEKVREVASENPGVILIDLWRSLMDKAIAMTPNDYQPGGPWLGSPENGRAGGLDELLPDGLHMSGDAYRVLYEQIRPHIGHEWDKPSGEDKTGYMLPDWRELNGATTAA